MESRISASMPLNQNWFLKYASLRSCLGDSLSCKTMWISCMSFLNVMHEEHWIPYSLKVSDDKLLVTQGFCLFLVWCQKYVRVWILFKYISQSQVTSFTRAWNVHFLDKFTALHFFIFWGKKQNKLTSHRLVLQATAHLYCVFSIQMLHLAVCNYQ